MSVKQDFIRSFRSVQPKMSRFYAKILGQAGLTLPQYALLNELANEGMMSMSEVGVRLHITKPAVTSLVDRMEKHQWVKRKEHVSDRRVYLLEILPKGRFMVRQVQALVLETLLKTFDALNAKEQAVIARFYSRLSETMVQTLGASTRRPR